MSPMTNNPEARVAVAEAERDEIAREVSRIAGCQVGSWRTSRIVDYILLREGHRPAATPASASCSCAEIAGEDPRCIRHGEGTLWAKENPDLCEFAEQLAEAKASPARGEVDALTDGLRERIEGVVEFNGCGFWRTCTGCYESEDGHPNGDYPHSEVLGCTLGGGCSECGGIGAVWDAIDYEQMAREMIAEDAAQPPAMPPQPAPAKGELEAAKKLLDRQAIRYHTDGTFRDWDNAVAAFAAHRIAALSAQPQHLREADGDLWDALEPLIDATAWDWIKWADRKSVSDDYKVHVTVTVGQLRRARSFLADRAALQASRGEEG